MGKGWNWNENLKFDTNWMKPCRFREKQETTTKQLCKGTPEGGAGNDEIWTMATMYTMCCHMECCELLNHFILMYPFITIFC